MLPKSLKKGKYVLELTKMKISARQNMIRLEGT